MHEGGELTKRRYQFYSSGTTGFTGGTSAASPVVGGIIGLINDARLRAGKPTMGFINPWLYARGYKALTDITGGSAWGCTGTNLQTGRRLAGAAVIPYASFNGTTGWDAATGWGVPNFTAMLEDAMSFV